MNKSKTSILATVLTLFISYIFGLTTAAFAANPAYYEGAPGLGNRRELIINADGTATTSVECLIPSCDLPNGTWQIQFVSMNGTWNNIKGTWAAIAAAGQFTTTMPLSSHITNVTVDGNQANHHPTLSLGILDSNAILMENEDFAFMGSRASDNSSIFGAFNLVNFQSGTLDLRNITDLNISIFNNLNTLNNGNTVSRIRFGVGVVIILGNSSNPGNMNSIDEALIGFAPISDEDVEILHNGYIYTRNNNPFSNSNDSAVYWSITTPNNNGQSAIPPPSTGGRGGRSR